MDIQRLTKNLCKLKPIKSRTFGRPKMRWEDGVINDLKNMNVASSKLTVDRR